MTAHAPAHSRPRAAGRSVGGAERAGVAAFVALAAAGLVLRALAARTTWLQPDSDEATGMIMALQASHGHLSLLFWGGNYGGALVSWIEAPLVAAFGFHLLTFWALDTILAVLAAVLLWRIATRLMPPLAAGCVGGTSLSFPALWIFWSMREYEFWLPSIVLALAAVLAAQRWGEAPGRGRALALGLLVGLAVWSYPLVAPLVLPAVALFCWAARRDRRTLAVAAAGALAGVLPWAAYFVVHGRKALAVQSTTGSAATTLRHTLTRVLPTALSGGQQRVDVVWNTPIDSLKLLAAIGIVAYLLALAVFVACVRARRAALAACAASVLLWPVFLYLGHVPVGVDSWRYGLIAVPPLLVLAGALLSRARLAWLLPAVAVASVATSVVPDTASLASAPGCNPSLSATDSFLVAQHRATSYGSYWLASALMACSPGRVTVGALGTVRDARSEAAAAAAAQSTYVVFPGRDLDTELAAWTKTHAPGTPRVLVPGGYAVWMFPQRVAPATIGLSGVF